VDRLLCDEFLLPEGLADDSVMILDPACGTGVFLLAVIDYWHQRSLSIEKLLPRLIGVEILPAAAFLAKLNIALKLMELGCDFNQVPCVRVITGDALSPLTQSKIQNPKSISHRSPATVTDAAVYVFLD